MLPQSNKLRAIDDGRFSGRNQASYSEETVFVSSPDSVSAACKYIAYNRRGATALGSALIRRLGHVGCLPDPKPS